MSRDLEGYAREVCFRCNRLLTMHCECDTEKRNKGEALNLYISPK